MKSFCVLYLLCPRNVGYKVFVASLTIPHLTGSHPSSCYHPRPPPGRVGGVEAGKRRKGHHFSLYLHQEPCLQIGIKSQQDVAAANQTLIKGHVVRRSHAYWFLSGLGQCWLTSLLSSWRRRAGRVKTLQLAHALRVPILEPRGQGQARTQASNQPTQRAGPVTD